MRTVNVDHRRQPFWFGRNAADRALGASCVLPASADESHGTSNLVSRPRAGNISSDMRAGLPG
jgi:hypothetical protein